VTELTRDEQNDGIGRIRTWLPAERRFVARLQNGERDTVILLAALLDIEPVEDDRVRAGTHRMRP
jgi:hypothetical protein